MSDIFYVHVSDFSFSFPMNSLSSLLSLKHRDATLECRNQNNNTEDTRLNNLGSYGFIQTLVKKKTFESTDFSKLTKTLKTRPEV